MIIFGPATLSIGQAGVGVGPILCMGGTEHCVSGGWVCLGMQSGTAACWVTSEFPVRTVEGWERCESRLCPLIMTPMQEDQSHAGDQSNNIVHHHSGEEKEAV